MKKIISLIISIIMLTGFCACTNTLKTANEKPPLEAALDTYSQTNKDYSTHIFSRQFNSTEVKKYMQEEKYSAFFDLIEVFQEERGVSKDDIEDTTLSVNMFLMFDFVFRPAFLGDKASFEERIPLILNDDFLYYSLADKDVCDESYIKYYVQNMRSKEINIEVADIAVPVIDKFCPTLTEANRNNLRSYYIWSQHRYFASIVIMNVDYEAGLKRAEEDDSITQEWLEKTFS